MQNIHCIRRRQQERKKISVGIDSQPLNIRDLDGVSRIEATA